MDLFPAKSAFIKDYNTGKNQVLFARLTADLDTPVSLMLKVMSSGEPCFMLESVTGGEVRGRYSVIGLKPDLVWRCRGTTSEINRNARFDLSAFEPMTETPLDALRSVIADNRIDLPEDIPPIGAGLFGYLGYDMIRHVEHLPNVNVDPLGLEDAILFRPTVTIVLDGIKGDVTVVSPVWVTEGISAEAAYVRAAERVVDVVNNLDREPLTHTRELTSETFNASPVSNTTKERYFEIVETARDYIKAGDIFQVVPSQRWSMDFDLPAFSLYRALRRTNPSPYMFFFDFGDFQLVGASPEILVKVKDEQVTIRPIAGTRPRGANEAEDRALEEDLLADEKERAEHLMLLDLGRNDVGRVAKIGTVKPTDQFIIERYSHVMHIVSNVVGELSEEHDPLSALLAGLPAGTVSGAPKVRAMEIIDELESEKRGVYGGGVGYFSASGEMDICIALRTGIVKDDKLFVQAGGGVVWDSDPEAEFQETVNKSKALLQAANEAARFVKFRGGQG